MEDRSCPLCRGSLLSGELLYLEGTCSHRVCVDCLGTKDDERRRQVGSAVGSDMPCPVCNEGLFDIERLPTYTGRIPEPVTSHGIVAAVTPQTKVKSERDDDVDEDKKGRILHRFQVADNHLDVMKQETDDESSTASSRFSAVSADDEDPALAEDEPPASSDKPSAKSPEEEVVVKEEPTIYELQQRSAKHARVYGDRDLLARQSKEGMMKLGGGNQSWALWPKSDEDRMKRLDGRFAIACMGGTTIGWEYCGELEDDIAGITAAASVSRECKTFILSDIRHSLSRPGGKWHGILDSYRDDIIDLCVFKPKDRATLSAKDLGLNDFPKRKLTQVEFAEKLVNWDYFYRSDQIVFKHYDETIYDFVKDGKTTKNKNNKKRKADEPCAKASDWYAILDQ
ncbi:hypothetical protein THAOC_26350, partial [Thalassiosira oceanica]